MFRGLVSFALQTTIIRSYVSQMICARLDQLSMYPALKNQQAGLPCNKQAYHVKSRLTMNRIRVPMLTLSPTAKAPPLGSIPTIPLIRKSCGSSASEPPFSSPDGNSLKVSGATASVRLLLTPSLEDATTLPLYLPLLSNCAPSPGLVRHEFSQSTYKFSVPVTFVQVCFPFQRKAKEVLLCWCYA